MTDTASEKLPPGFWWHLFIGLGARAAALAAVCLTIIMCVSIYSGDRKDEAIERARFESAQAPAIAEQLKYKALIKSQEVEELRTQIELDNRRRNIGGAKTKGAKK